MGDEKILEMLKQEGENLEIPESLKPERIQKKLGQKPHNVLKYKRFYAGLSVCACFALMISGIYRYREPVKDRAETENPSAISNTKVVPKAQEIPNRTYHDIYRALERAEIQQSKSVQNKEKSATSGGVVEESVSVLEDSEGNVGKTNLRTEGVDEGDIIKNDGSFLYQLQTDFDTGKSKIRIVGTQAKGKMKEISVINDIGRAVEFYLWENKMVVIEQEDRNRNAKTNIHIFDLKDKRKPAKIQTISQDGDFETSRIRDGFLYTFTRFYAATGQEKKIEKYVPTVNQELLSEDCIVLPEVISESSYLLITGLKLSDPESFTDKKGMISAGYQYYVSSDHIYTAGWKDSMSYDTKIYSYAYHDGKIMPESSGTVPGSINDSFSMDEYNGYLRVVTTTVGRSSSENGLYILNSGMKIIGKITGIAKGERIYSARFLGDIGYFVTFRNTDPLFSVDLSNPTKPKILGELKIPGFSEYLHFYEEGHLLGIGSEINPKTGENLGVKLSMFDISDPSNVKEIHKKVISNHFYSEAFHNYKSVLIDPEKNLFGFASEYDYFVYSYDKKKGFLQKFRFKDANMVRTKPEQEREGMNEDWQQIRGTYIKDTFYLMKEKEGIEAYHLESKKKIGELNYE